MPIIYIMLNRRFRAVGIFLACASRETCYDHYIYSFMKVSYRTLDKVLFRLNELPDKAQYCQPLRESLNMDKQVLDAALSVLESDGFFGKVYRIEEAPGYHAVYFNEKGRAFAATSSYRRKYWQEMPARYWWVAVVFALLTFTVPLYLQYCTKQTRQQSQEERKELLQPSPTK